MFVQKVLRKFLNNVQLKFIESICKSNKLDNKNIVYQVNKKVSLSHYFIVNILFILKLILKVALMSC